jgi:hypothetical protein
MIAILAGSAIVPALLLMWYFHARDVFREPPRVLWATFGLGVLTIPGVLLVAVPLDRFIGFDQMVNPYANGFGNAFVIAAIPEELFKFVVLYAYASRHKEFDEPMDGVVYGATASLGFATLENVLYVVSGGVGVAVMRAITAVPGHAFTGAIMGYFVGQARFRPAERGRLLVASLAYPILLHGLYDAGLMVPSAFGKASEGHELEIGVMLLMTLVTLIVEIVWGVRVVGRLRREQLAAAAQAAAFAPAMPAPMAAPWPQAVVAPGFTAMSAAPVATPPAAPTWPASAVPAAPGPWGGPPTPPMPRHYGSAPDVPRRFCNTSERECERRLHGGDAAGE